MRRELILCDTDTSWLGRLHGYLNEHIKLPLTFADYTDPSLLPEGRARDNAALLVAGEDAAAGTDLTGFARVLIVTDDAPGDSESDDAAGTADNGIQLRRISRYSGAGAIAGAILEMLSEGEGLMIPGTDQALSKTMLVAHYTPGGSAMQSPFAIAQGQILSGNKNVLYLNFGPFPIRALLPDESGTDMSDLLYYNDCQKERLPLFIQRAKGRCGALMFLYPPSSYLQTNGCTSGEWMNLITELCKEESPDILLLDLSDTVQGVFDILSACSVIYTDGGHDIYEKSRTKAYRRWIVTGGMEDILAKTVFYELPRMMLPGRPGQLAGSELGSYIRRKGLLP